MDTSSSAYLAGSVAGIAILMLIPGGGILGTAVLAMQIEGSLWNAYDAFRAGDYVGGSVQLAFAALGGMRLFGALRGAGGAGSAANGVGGAGARGIGMAQNQGALGLFANGGQNLMGVGRVGNGLGMIGNGARVAGGWINNASTWMIGVGRGSLGNNYVRDALIGSGLSLVGYTVSTGVSSMMNGALTNGNWQFSVGGFLGAAAGGAAGGATFRLFAGRSPTFVGAMSGGAGGSVGGFVTSTVDQWRQNGFSGIDWTQVGAHTLNGALAGTIGGAVAGGVMGANPGWGRILIGGTTAGIVGGAVGGGIGAYMNQEDVGWGALVGGVSGGSGGLAASGGFLGGRALAPQPGNAPGRDGAAALEARDATVPIGQGRIRFSQGDVSPHTGEGTPIGDVIGNMRRNGWNPNAPRVEMVEFPDGGLVTLDHRRFVAARIAGIEEVPARIHPFAEPIPADAAGRFQLRVGFTDPVTGTTYQTGQLPQTWGEAAMFRSANQRSFGFPDFPVQGSVNDPRIRPPSNLGR